MSPLRVLRGFIFGGLGGVLGWILIEFLFNPARWEQPGAPVRVSRPTELALEGATLGVAIGLFLGVSEGLAEGTMGRFRRAFLTFLVLGPVGGFVGFYFGQILYAMLGGSTTPNVRPDQFFSQLLARSLGWMLLGLMMGIVFGLANLSFRRAWNGAVGGALGGFLGGFVFQVLAFTGIFGGSQLRFLGFMIVGAAIGFFINLIAEAMKRVWVKVLIGRNEGREHVLDTPLAYVGRDELAEVPVFLDPAVPKRMASFRLADGRYALHPESNALPILVNGQPVQPGHLLRDGDAIQFGRVTLAYFEKATATGLARPVDTVPLADFSAPSVVRGATPIPTAANVCQFCGEVKDPATGACACSVPAEPGYDPAGYPAGAYGAPADAAPGYAPTVGYAPAPDYPPASGWPPGGDPGYAATVMQPAPAGGYIAPPGAGGPCLIGTGGPLAGQVFPLAGVEITVGREPTNMIALNGDSTASRRHARLFPAGAGWVVRDEGSANGTWVNGVRIQEQPLYPGDGVRFGGSEFRFEA